MLARMRERARRMKREGWALYYAARHPQTPWYAKLVVVACVAYALAPADIFPDFLPVLGFIDDLIFVPLAFAFAARFIPGEVLAECREKAVNRT
jgi:uncharacterized membrane protein YkvA (DUF1232 family)